MLAILAAGFLAACTDLPGWTRAGCTYTAANATVNLPTQFSQNSTFELDGKLAKWDYVVLPNSFYAAQVVNVTNNAHVVIKDGIVRFPMMRVQGEQARMTYQNVTLKLLDWQDLGSGPDQVDTNFIAYYTAGIDHAFYNVKIDCGDSVRVTSSGIPFYKMNTPAIFAGYNNVTYFLSNVHLVQIPEWATETVYGDVNEILYYTINKTNRYSQDLFSMTSSSVYKILPAWGPVNLQVFVFPYNIQDLGGNTGPELPTFSLQYQIGMVQQNTFGCPSINCAEKCNVPTCSRLPKPPAPITYKTMFRGLCKSCTGVYVYSSRGIPLRNTPEIGNNFIPQCITPFEDVPCDAPPPSAVTDFHAHDFGVHAHASEQPHEHPTSRGTPRSTWAALGLGASALLAV